MSLSLPIALSISASAILLNFWLMLRVGQVRKSEGVSVGDGGNEIVIRRMRAHANFTESAPLVIILIALIEFNNLAIGWLSYLAGAYIIGRLLHAFGMDGGALKWGRMVGIIITMLTMVILAFLVVFSLLTAP
jgi:uncharacterized membrane protein YecN with MAPEG domain